MVHVDGLERVLSSTVRNFEPGKQCIFKRAACGLPISLTECAVMSSAPMVCLPGKNAVTSLVKLFRTLGHWGVPPEALPYFLGSYTIYNSRLQQAVDADYPSLIQQSSWHALADGFRA